MGHKGPTFGDRHADDSACRSRYGPDGSSCNSLCFTGLLLTHKCTISGIGKMIAFLDLHNYLNSNKTRPSAVQQGCSTQVSCLIYLFKDVSVRLSVKMLLNLLLKQSTVPKVQDRTRLSFGAISRCKLTSRLPRASLQHLGQRKLDTIKSFKNLHMQHI